MANRQKSDVRYWLVKTEPEVFSIDDFLAAPSQTTCWDGVRNFQARNFLRDHMKIGDPVLIYHSNASPPAVVGWGVVVREGYPDHTAWDPSSRYYDPTSSPDNPRWYMVDIQAKEKFHTPLTLDQLRRVAALRNMELLRRGSRLSVQPVRPIEFATIMRLAGASWSRSPT